jgi:hypothetical protein
VRGVMIECSRDAKDEKALRTKSGKSLHTVLFISFMLYI